MFEFHVQPNIKGRFIGWTRRKRAAAIRGVHAWITGLPLIRGCCYQPRIELHSHETRHVVRYGLAPDGLWWDLGSTVDTASEDAVQQYFELLRAAGQTWLKPLEVEGTDFIPLPALKDKGKER